MLNDYAMPNVDAIVYVLDMVGVVACTVAATVLAKRLDFDIFGAFLISCLGSIGGGTVRDVLLNRHPIFWLHDLNYLYLIAIVSLIVQILYHWVERLDKAMRWFDALGLAAFTVIGLEAALSRGMNAPIAVMMGAITAVMGGVMRDIVCRVIPLVFQKDIYITASIVGSIYYLLMLELNMNTWLRGVSTMALIFTIRMLAIYRQWNLPNITIKPRIKH